MDSASCCALNHILINLGYLESERAMKKAPFDPEHFERERDWAVVNNYPKAKQMKTEAKEKRAAEAERKFQEAFNGIFYNGEVPDSSEPPAAG